MKPGIICDLSYTRSLLIENYYHSIKNIYGDAKLIKGVDDLLDIDILFIGNDHFLHHKNIWLNDLFIDTCNKKNIKVVIIGGEKIFNTHYEWNVLLQNSLSKFNNIHQYVWDVEDSIILNKKIIGYPISKHYSQFFQNTKKNNKCLFIGQYKAEPYAERRKVLDNIQKYIETDIMTDVPGNWKEYLNLYSEYKYALCPFSTYSNGIPTRFYEALLTNCIPILQVRSNTLNYYPEEASIPECIFFEDVEELQYKIGKNEYSYCKSKLWAEDKMIKLFKEDGIPVPD